MISVISSERKNIIQYEKNLKLTKNNTFNYFVFFFSRIFWKLLDFHKLWLTFKRKITSPDWKNVISPLFELFELMWKIENWGCRLQYYNVILTSNNVIIIITLYSQFTIFCINSKNSESGQKTFLRLGDDIFYIIILFPILIISKKISNIVI